MASHATTAEVCERIIANVERVVVGKRRVIRLALVSLLCEGHVLLEDVPGVAKTMLARSLAVSLGCSSTGFSARPTCCRRM